MTAEVKDLGGMLGFVGVTLDNSLLGRQIPTTGIPVDSMVEVRWDILADSGTLWQSDSRRGIRLWILDDYYPGSQNAHPSHPRARVYEDVLAGVAHVRGPASFWLAGNIRLVQYLAANPTATQLVQARIRYGEPSTQLQTQQRIMWPVENLVPSGYNNVEFYGSIDGREVALDGLRRVQWIGARPTTATGRVRLETANEYGPAGEGLFIAGWTQNEGGCRDMVPMVPTVNLLTPNIVRLYNDSADTLSGELWFFGGES